MIQLIATDMDGSLLNSRKELPPRFPALLKALHMRGIRFAVSSGSIPTCSASFPTWPTN